MRQLSSVPLEVVVEGEKALDQPSRLARTQIGVKFGSGLNYADAAAVTSEAKGLCTVTNTCLGSRR
jgi:hypothetical protein